MLCSHRLLWISSRRTVVSNQNKIHYVYRMAEIFSAVFFLSQAKVLRLLSPRREISTCKALDQFD